MFTGKQQSATGYLAMDYTNETFLSAVNMAADGLFSHLYQNLLDTFSRATSKEVRDGIDWYPKARRLAKDCAEKTGLDWQVCAAIIAVMSPQNSWYGPNGQEYNTLPLIRWFQAGNDWRGAPGLGIGANKEKARQMVLTNSPSGLKGPKVEAFYAAICGEQATTLDVWAIRVAFNLPLLSENIWEVAKVEGSPKVRAVLKAAYIAAADTVGLREEEFQAVVWIVGKREMAQTVKQRSIRCKEHYKTIKAARKAARTTPAVSA